MAFSTKLKLTDAKFIQESGSNLTLSGDTTIATSGDLRYAVHPNFTGDTQIVDKKYVDDNIGTGTTAATTYNLSTPSTVTVGGLNAGSNLTGLTSNEILEDILVPYLPPAFTSFSISGQQTTVEVDTSNPILSGNQDFTWSTSQSANVASNSIVIRDVTGAVDLATGLANDGSQTVNVGTINLTANNQTYSWRGQGTNTIAGSFNSSNFTITSIHPYFYGTVSSGGAEPGASRPTATNSLVTGGTKVVANSTGTITIDFNSTNDDYLWFAIPSTSTNKTVWFINELNSGTIGGSVSPGGNLFPNNDGISISTAKWGGVPYRVYISNYQSEVSDPMQMRNS